MSQFQLFDSVKLIEPITLTEGETAPEGTVGSIVEVFNDGEACLVELFGSWVKYDKQGGFIPAAPEDPEAFMETIGVETVYPNQISLAASAREMMGDHNSLRVLADELSDDLVAEVLDFAEFLKLKQQRQISAEG
jgi:hypothetical protein